MPRLPVLLGSHGVTVEWPALRGRRLDSERTAREFFAVHRPQRDRSIVLVPHLNKSESARAPVETVAYDFGLVPPHQSRRKLPASRHRPARNSSCLRIIEFPYLSPISVIDHFTHSAMVSAITHRSLRRVRRPSSDTQ